MNHSLPNVCNAKRHDDEEIVRNGLSLTPSQMLEMTQKGVPIAARNLSAIVDNVSDNDFDISPEYRRGVDISELYEAHEDARKKARGVLKRHRAEQAAQLELSKMQQQMQKGGE